MEGIDHGQYSVHAIIMADVFIILSQHNITTNWDLYGSVTICVLNMAFSLVQNTFKII